MPSSARNSACPSKSGVGVNSVLYHQEPSAIEPGAWLKLSPMYGSGYTLLATRPANTVVGTVTGYQPAVAKPGTEICAPELPVTFAAACSAQPLRRKTRPALQLEQPASTSLLPPLPPLPPCWLALPP